MPATFSDVTWSDYVRRTLGGDQQIEAATKTGLDQSTISRWVRGAAAGRVENVVRFARGYSDRTTVLEAFLVAGFVAPEDVRGKVTITQQVEPTDDELIELLRRRLGRDRQEGVGSRGDSTANTQAGGSPATSPEQARWDASAADLRGGPRGLSEREVLATLGPRPGETAPVATNDDAGQGTRRRRGRSAG